jgi:hypothetical protein
MSSWRRSVPSTDREARARGSSSVGCEVTRSPTCRRLIVRGSWTLRISSASRLPHGNPIPGMLVADLSEDQRARLRQVLDGMLRERAGADGRAVLTNAVNIGIGTK